MWDAIRKVEHFYDRLEWIPACKEMIRYAWLIVRRDGDCDMAARLEMICIRRNHIGRLQSEWKNQPLKMR
jgi:hypothetical protein